MMSDNDRIPQPGNLPRVFLSYASEDSFIAGAIARELKRKGVEVRWGKWRINAGDSLRQKIDEGLAECSHFLVLLTPESVNKPWVKQEMDADFIQKLKDECIFMPILYRLPAEQLPPLFKVIHSPELEEIWDVDLLFNEIVGGNGETRVGEPAHDRVDATANRTVSTVSASAISQRKAELEERARHFRQERLEIIRNGESWNPMSEGPLCVLHWIPLSPMTGEPLLEIETIAHQCVKFISVPTVTLGSTFMTHHGRIFTNREPTPEGLRVYGLVDEDEAESENVNKHQETYRGFQYFQVFETGELESVYAPQINKAEDGAHYMTFDLSSFFREQILCFWNNASLLGLSGPTSLGVTVLRTKGFSVGHGFRDIGGDMQNSGPTEETDIILSEWPLYRGILDVEDPDEEIIRPVLNKIWRYFGAPRCDRYDQNDTWTHAGDEDEWICLGTKLEESE